MPYYKMLNEIVAKTSYSQEEIANKCTELGVPMSKSYMNKLLNNKLSAPKEEISRAIAKVCNADERLLVMEGYIDKAPKEVSEAFNSLRNMQTLVVLNTLENRMDNKTFEEFRELFEKEPLAKFIIDLIENGNNAVDIKQMGMEIKAENENLIMNIGGELGIKVEDNSMYPLIKKNDEIKLLISDRYVNGDILLININDNTVIRQAVFLGNDIELIPLNKEYETKTYKKEEIKILGKVQKIITEI